MNRFDYRTVKGADKSHSYIYLLRDESVIQAASNDFQASFESSSVRLSCYEAADSGAALVPHVLWRAAAGCC